MYKITLVFILVSLYVSSSSITYDQVRACVIDKCSNTYLNCDNDIACSASLPCFSKCSFNDSSCIEPCYEKVASNQFYWELELCAFTCMEILELEENSNQLPMCINSNCGSKMAECPTDTVCTEALTCISSCTSSNEYKLTSNELNFTCPASCMVKYVNNNTLLGEIIKCEVNCIANFINN